MIINFDSGKATEHKTLSIIGDELGYKSINNLILKHYNVTCEIDHIILTRKHIYVVETKNWNGKVEGSQKDIQWKYYSNNSYYTKLNPITQNQKHINLLVNKYRLPKSTIINLVVYSNDADINGVQYEEKDNLKILKQKDLKRFISDKEGKDTSIFTNLEVDELKRKIKAQKSNDNVRRKHIRDCIIMSNRFNSKIALC